MNLQLIRDVMTTDRCQYPYGQRPPYLPLHQSCGLFLVLLAPDNIPVESGESANENSSWPRRMKPMPSSSQIITRLDCSRRRWEVCRLLYRRHRPRSLNDIPSPLVDHTKSYRRHRFWRRQKVGPSEHSVAAPPAGSYTRWTRSNCE